MPDQRVLVVGTTGDYIDLISERYPTRALFLTDLAERANSLYARPKPENEILCPLTDREQIVSQLVNHLNRFGQTLSGVCCYDCEWLSLAAYLAERLGLPYPTEDSVLLARDKYRSKQVWFEQGVNCPRSELVLLTAEALQLCQHMGGPVVLKPLTGSGSELTFLCKDSYDLGIAYRALVEGLARRKSSPMYHSDSHRSKQIDTTSLILAEQWIEGREFSADFIIEHDSVALVRVAKKVRDDVRSFGTTLAYLVPGRMPGWITYEELAQKLGRAARKLGLKRAVCMADFIITEDEMVLLELTPRIGGDCLPSLVRAASGLDTIGLALDFAEQKPIDIPPIGEWRQTIGLRLLAAESGVLASIDSRKLVDDPAVKEIYIKHEAGHEIKLPPDDYASWVLGHLIFEADNDTPPRQQCENVSSKITINVEQYRDQTLSWFHDDGGRTVQPSGPAA